MKLKKRTVPEAKENPDDPSQWQRQGFCFYCLMPLEVRFAGKDVRHAHNFTPYSRCAQAKTR